MTHHGIYFKKSDSLKKKFICREKYPETKDASFPSRELYGFGFLSP
jgi:hypothetical protein